MRDIKSIRKKIFVWIYEFFNLDLDRNIKRAYVENKYSINPYEIILLIDFWYRITPSVEIVERPPSDSDSDSVLSDASESDSDEDEEPPPVPQRPENTRSIYTKSLIGRTKLIIRYLNCEVVELMGVWNWGGVELRGTRSRQIKKIFAGFTVYLTSP